MKRILNFGAPAPDRRRDRRATTSTRARPTPSRSLPRCAPLDDKDGRPLLTDVQITREENYPELDVVVDRAEGGRRSGSPSSRSRRPCSPAWSATRSSRPFPSPTRRPATSTSSTCGSTIAYRSHVADLSRLFMRTPRGGDGAARHRRAASSAAAGRCVINRKYLQRIIDVTANVAPGKDLGAASAAVQRVLDELPPPDGFTVRLGGQTEAQKQAFDDLVVRGAHGARCSSTWCWRRSSSR